MNKQEQRQCHFCVNDIDEVDWKNTEVLKKFLTHQYKIAHRKRTGLCAKHQRRLAKAIKRARISALLPFTAHKR